MSQLIACKNQRGIVLAADSKAIDIDAAGNITEFTISRLFPLTHHSVILSGGAAAGENMARSLKNFVAEEDFGDVDEVYSAALPFLASEYTEFMRKACEIQQLEPAHHVYFILAGRSAQDPENPYKMYFLWTKNKRPQLDGDEISVVFTVPRVFRLEYKLSRIAAENTDITGMQAAVLDGMASQAERNEEVGGPFQYAVITQDGINIAEV